jgi:hypothetical protein
MLTERIVGALTFRQGVYAAVEANKTFTATAWIFVLARPDRGRVRQLAWPVV